MSDSTGMDPYTLSSIKFFTEGVLILSPWPRTPESCQILLFMPESGSSLSFHRLRASSSRSILSTVSRFLSGLRCFLSIATSRTTFGINAMGSVFLLYRCFKASEVWCCLPSENNKEGVVVVVVGGVDGRRRAWSLLPLLHSHPSSYGLI